MILKQQKILEETGKKVVTDSNFLPHKQPKQIQKKYCGTILKLGGNNPPFLVFKFNISSKKN